MTARCTNCRGVLDHAAFLCDAETCTSCELERIAKPADEWAYFLGVIRKVAAEHNGRVDWTHVRPQLRGRVQHKHIGQLTRRAKHLGLLVAEKYQPSQDDVGKNTGRLEPVYRLTA